MHDRKIVGYLPVLLPFGDDFPQQVDGCCLRSAQLWRTHWIHGSGENYSLPQRPPHLGYVSQSLVKSAQAFLGRGFDGKFRLQAFCLARERAASHFAQNRILAGEIAEKSGLADFQSMHYVVDAGVLIAPLPKKVQGRFDDLLAKARFLAFTKAAHLALPRTSGSPAGLRVFLLVSA